MTNKPPPGGHTTYPDVGKSTLHFKISTKQKLRIINAGRKMNGQPIKKTR